MVYLDWAAVLVFIAAVVAGLIFFLDGRMVLFVSTIGAGVIAIVLIQFFRR